MQFGQAQPQVKTLKALIVVDVQKCFLDGTLGIQDTPELKDGETRTYIRYLQNLQNWYNANKGKYQVLIFTKDSHPIHHGSHGTMDPHCISLGSEGQCGGADRENDIARKFANNFYLPYIRQPKPQAPYSEELIQEGISVYRRDYVTDMATEAQGDMQKALSGRTLGSFEDAGAVPYDYKISLTDQGKQQQGKTLSEINNSAVDQAGNFTNLQIVAREQKDPSLIGDSYVVVRLNKG